MTKLWILSDLHLDDKATYIPTPPAEGYDVVVLAGDIAGNPIKSMQWAERTFMRPAVVIAGNHEYFSEKSTYDRRLSRGLETSRKRKIAGVHFLENTSVTLSGTRFLGSTLWTDFALDDDQTRGMHIAATSMPDYQNIPRDAGGWMTAAEILAIHYGSIAWLDEQMSIPFEGPTVIVTHHAPSGRSVGEEFRGDELNVAFASDLHRYIERWQAELWIHGHIHSSSDYSVGQTRVICNPKLNNPSFQPHMVIDVRKRPHEQRYENGVPVDEYGYPMPIEDMLDLGPDETLEIVTRAP